MKAKRAVFMAAGFGSRMVPVTLKMPKPLVPVHGQRIIDGLIDSCLAAGIEEIYIVRGYLGEKFDDLLTKYPNLKFIDNPYYETANNISSVFVARDYLEDAYVFEADLLISNPTIITSEHESSDFLAIPVESTDDWCFSSEEGFITGEFTESAEPCHQMVGISFWSAEDGRKLKEDVEDIFAREDGKQYYWEQIPLGVRKDRYRVAIRECRKEDIVEIDSFEELKALDESYASWAEE